MAPAISGQRPKSVFLAIFLDPWGLGVMAFGIRALFLLISDNHDGDAFARVVLSRKVAAEGVVVPTEVWLPSHFWILAAPCWFGLSGQLWLRMATALAGALTVPALYFLLRRLFDDRVACLSTLALCLNPLHIRLSVVTVSETFFLLLLTLALWAYEVHGERGGSWSLVSGSLALNLACGMRLEGWLFLPALPAAALMGSARRPTVSPKLRFARALAFATASSLFAVGWAGYSWRTYGDPLHMATLTQETNRANALYQDLSLWYRLAFWPVLLCAAMGPQCFARSLHGVSLAMRGPRRSLGLLFLGFLGIYYVQNFRSAMITQARYGLLLIWILLINFGVFAFRSSRSLNLGRLGITSLIWLLLIWGLAEAPFGVLSTKLQSISPRPRFQPAVHQIDMWLRSHGRNAPLYIGPLKGEYEPWMSSFDLWYPVEQVRVIQSRQELRALIRASRSIGYWVADHAWIEEQQSDPACLETIGELHPYFSTGGFTVYGWPAAQGSEEGVERR